MNKRILVVEDHEDNLRIMRDLLNDAGFEVIEARSGNEALSVVEAERPNLIIMDIQLPGLDGLEATRRIKDNPVICHIPVIAVTSYAMSEDNEKAIAAGCDAYFTKPVSPRRLLAKIREYLP